MIGGKTVFRRHVMLAAIGAVCFFAAAQASNNVAVQANGLSALWAANAVLLALLLSWGRDAGSTIAICAGAFAASILASYIRGQPIELGVIFACANLIEALCALLVLRAFGGTPGPLAKVRDVFAFIVACLLAPLVSGAIASTGLALTNNVPLVSGFVGWYLAAFVSLALVTPGIVTTIELATSTNRRPPRTGKLIEAAVVLGIVALAAICVFYLAGHDAMFVLMPFTLLATFRLRQFGAIASIGIIAAIAATATAQGFGPIASAAISSSGKVIYLQLFLTVIFTASLPVGAALAERDARADEAHVIADHFKAVVENSGDVIFRTDCAGRWTYLNPAWEELSGFQVEESLGRSWDDCIDPSEHREVAEWAGPVFAGEVLSTRRMLRFHTARGAIRWMELSIQALADKAGEIVGTTGTVRDVHDRKRLEEQVMSAKRKAEERERVATLLASTDELTGLQNRRVFLRQLDLEIVATNDDGRALAVAIFDVDHFKAVNDSHGHAVGDRVLQRVADRAVNIVRGGDLVGRLGGEEFGILMPGATLDEAALVAERLRKALEQIAGEADLLPAVTVSIGIAAHTLGQTGASLLADADRALYSAKGAGRNRIKIAA